MSKSGGLWFLALSFALSIILRVPLLFQHPFTFVDEAWVASTAKVLVEGGKLYLDVWCNKQPLLLFFSEFLFQVFGLHMEAIHLAALFLVFLVSTLLFCIGSSFFSPAVGGGAALTYALLSTTYYTPRIIGTTTEGLMLVLYLCRYLLLSPGQSEGSSVLLFRSRPTVFFGGHFQACRSDSNCTVLHSFAAQTQPSQGAATEIAGPFGRRIPLWLVFAGALSGKCRLPGTLVVSEPHLQGGVCESDHPSRFPEQAHPPTLHLWIDYQLDLAVELGGGVKGRNKTRLPIG